MTIIITLLVGFAVFQLATMTADTAIKIYEGWSRVDSE